MGFYRSLLIATTLIASPILATSASAALDWTTALTGEHRKAGNADRNGARHPQETLEFFGLQPGMTVMEVSPGGGWYTEVLAPLLMGDGTLIAAHYQPNGGDYARGSLGGFLKKLGDTPDVYREVVVSYLQPPVEVTPAMPNSVDLAVAFRNVHSWMRMNQAEAFLSAIFDALKPGGVFGVVQHRAAPGTDVETMKKTGYVTEEKVIELAELAGLELVEKSEINANALDTKNYPKGVWTLPPSLRNGEVDKDKYLAIGESDRMTLKFVKPAS